MIELTDLYGNIIYVNISRIQYVRDVKSSDRPVSSGYKGPAAQVVFSNDEQDFKYVRGKAATIATLIADEKVADS